MAFGIEFVCTGNGGRSPQAQTIGRDYVLEKGLEGRVEIYSSGSAVEDVMNLNFPMSELISYIEVGLENGTYQGKALKKAQYIVKEKNEWLARAAENGHPLAKEMIEYCTKYLMADEVAKRNMVLLELGLVPEGPFHKQTVVRDDVQLILPMKQSNADRVKEIYEGSRRSPVIVPICEYAGMDGAISDPFGKEFKVWRQTRDMIKEVVIKSIDRAVKEYL